MPLIRVSLLFPGSNKVGSNPICPYESEVYQCATNAKL